MHIADGVLSEPVVATGIVVTGAITAYAVSKTKKEELPKMSLLTGVFFIASLFSLPLPGPTCVHPMLAAFLGILLGSKAVIPILVGLGLQAFLLQYGGISTLGINTLLVTLPAFVGAYLFHQSRNYLSTVLKRGAFSALVATVLVGVFLSFVMYFSDERYAEGFITGGGFVGLIEMILATHLVLAVVVEAPVTGFALRYINHARPSLVSNKG